MHDALGHLQLINSLMSLAHVSRIHVIIPRILFDY